VGSNGAGKTTALSVIMGLIKPDAGTVNVLGSPAFDPACHAGRVTLMPQDAAMPPHSRVAEILSFYAWLQGIRRRETPARVREALDWVHLADRANSPIRTLSHGMRRRVAVAQAFLGDPEVVLLDEPTSGLDPREVARMRDLLCRRRNTQTVVMSSHNLHELERLCDHVVFIERGRVVRHGPMDAFTGRLHTLEYRLTPAAIPLDRLRSELPSAEFDFSVTAAVLTCRYPGQEVTTEEVNRRVLSCLLEAGVGILEIRRGNDLETAYLEQK
jgi:ABC-type multidrug transport system ATPase subunit